MLHDERSVYVGSTVTPREGPLWSVTIDENNASWSPTGCSDVTARDWHEQSEGAKNNLVASRNRLHL